MRCRWWNWRVCVVKNYNYFAKRKGLESEMRCFLGVGGERNNRDESQMMSIAGGAREGRRR